MKKILILICSVPILYFASEPNAEAQILDRVASVSRYSADTASMVASIASAYDVPVLAELSQKTRLNVPTGKQTLRTILNHLSSGASKIRWKQEDGVILLYESPLDSAPENFMNWRLSSFNVPGTLADLQLNLNDAIRKRQLRVSGEGSLASGLRNSNLVKCAVPTTTLRNVTVRQILIAYAARSQKCRYYSVVLYPTSAPAKKDEDSALESWRWFTVAEAPVGMHVDMPKN